jgi:hypothetical protein
VKKIYPDIGIECNRVENLVEKGYPVIKRFLIHVRSRDRARIRIHPGRV